MAITLDSLTYQPGNTRDVTIGQMVEVCFRGPKPPAYSREQVFEIATAWARFTDEFGFPRSQTWGQGPGHETGWFWSRVNVNQVKPDQNNWGGLGADNSGAAGGTFGPKDGMTGYEHGALAFMCHMALYVFGEQSQWPAHLQKYAQYAYRLNAVRGAHNTRKKPDGQLLRYLGTVKRIRDFVNGRWAESDGIALGTLLNGYANGIVAKANEVRSMPRGEEPPVADKPIIALAAGHHNTNRGGAVGEYERVGPLTREIAKQMREHGGFDVRMITPNDGMGDFGGGLQDVAREAVRLNADCFLEVHMEGNGAGDAGRGCFTIYPDWPPDVDTDVRDRLGPDLANRVRMLTALPLRGNGLMSEKSTGVGSQGFRLGAFGASAAARATMTRLLFEYGALTSPKDRAIIDGPQFNQYAAQATVAALAAFYGVKKDDPGHDPRLPEKPHPGARGFPQTGQWIMLGFLAYWQQFNDDRVSIEVFGYPLTGELPWQTPSGAQGAVQYFERAVFEYHPDIGKVLLRRLGAEALEAA